MSIRTQIRRALHKSAGSADSSTTTSTTASSNNSQSSDTPLSSQKSSILSRAFTWSGREKDIEPKKEKTKSKKRYTHPSEKPLTAQNLKHQVMFSNFTMTFGASDPSQIHRLSLDGISPCCTRRPSLDGDAFSSEASSQHYHSTDEDSMVPP